MIKIEPNDVSAHYTLGYALVLQGRYDDVIAELQKVLALNPKHTNAKLKMMTAMMLKERATRVR